MREWRVRIGFTLIELLVVIGIITILAAILLPGLAQIRERARLTVCLNNLRQLAIMSNVYTVDNKGRFPCGYQDYIYESHAGQVRWRDDCIPRRRYLHQVWGLQLGNQNTWGNDWYIRPPGKYLSDPGVFFCPGHVRRGTMSGNLKWWPDMEYVWGYYGNSRPNDAKSQNVYISYIVFQGGRQTPYTSVSSSDPAYGTMVPNRIVPARKLLNASSPAVCWLFADTYKTKDGGFDVEKLNHYVGAYSSLTAPFDVAHLDSHVDTHQWDPLYQGWAVQGSYTRGGWIPYGNERGSTPVGRQITGVDTDNDKRAR